MNWGIRDCLTGTSVGVVSVAIGYSDLQVVCRCSKDEEMETLVLPFVLDWREGPALLWS